jgi:hypothetical protein
MSKQRSKWSKGARQTIPGLFVARQIEMLESPAWRALSLSAHRLLDFLDVLNRQHGGKRNGTLVATFDQLSAAYGTDRHAIASAVREACALGFVVIMRQGCAGNADQRQPTQYRLTYHPAEGVPGYGSNEWRSIETSEEANRIATEARRATAPRGNGRRVKFKTPVWKTPPRPVWETPTGAGVENPTETHHFPGVENPTNLDISAH